MWGARIRTLIARAWITLALVESAWLAYPLVRARVLALEDTPAARGRRVAAGLGCFGCHGTDPDDVRQERRRPARVRARRRAPPQAREPGLPGPHGGGGAPHACVPRLPERRRARGPGRLSARRLRPGATRGAPRRPRRGSRHGARLLRLPRSARRWWRTQPGLAQGLRAGLLGCGLRRPRAQRRGALALDRGGRDPANHRAPDQRVLLSSPGDQDGSLRPLPPRGRRPRAGRLRALDPRRRVAPARALMSFLRVDALASRGVASRPSQGGSGARRGAERGGPSRRRGGPAPRTGARRAARPGA